jgi:hypothetical protein
VDREETRTVTQVIGANMRRIRESRAKVLHDVATAARDLGLTWDASAVSRIETGRRGLDLEEFLALPYVMTLALNETVTLVDLLHMDWEEEGAHLSSFDRETYLLPVVAMLAEPWIGFVKPEYLRTAGETIRKHLDEEKRRAQMAREPDEQRDIAREVQAIADEFGVRHVEVWQAYQALWGGFSSSLAREREKRLLGSGADLSSPTSVRTLRGHITRQLMAELRDYFATRKHSDRPAGVDA